MYWLVPRASALDKICFTASLRSVWVTPGVVAMTADVEVASADEGLDRLPLPLLADAWLWLWEPVEWVSTSSSESSVLIADPGAANFSLGIVFPLMMCWMRKLPVVMMSPSRSFLSGLPAPLFFSFLRILPTLVHIFS